MVKFTSQVASAIFLAGLLNNGVDAFAGLKPKISSSALKMVSLAWTMVGMRCWETNTLASRWSQLGIQLEARAFLDSVESSKVMLSYVIPTSIWNLRVAFEKKSLV
jgi:hypothetical protein